MFHFHKYKDPNCKVRHPIPYRRTELCSIWYDMGVLMMMMMMNFLLPPQGEEVSFSSRTDEKLSRLLLPVRVRRSRRRFPLFLVALDEKIAVKKSPLHEVLLIHDIEYDVDEDEKILVGKEFQTTLSYVVELVPKLWLPIRFIEGRLCREVKTNLLCVREEAQRIQRLKGEMLDICSVNLEHKHDEVQINYIKK
ncbi:hypothetical protein GW17_00025733, partial [Ensete ventricosum]